MEKKPSFEELCSLARQKRKQAMEELRADASEILRCVTQLKGIHRRNEMVEAHNEKRSQELELKEKKLQSLSSDLAKRIELFEKEKSEADDLKKQVEECREEVRSKRNELTAKLDTSIRIQREIELKKKQLGQLAAQFQRLMAEAGKIQIRKKEMEDESDRKKNELSLILDKIKESGKQFVTFDEQLEYTKGLLEMKSLELGSKEEELRRVSESIKLTNSEFELKEKKVESLNNCIAVCGEQIDSKSKELGRIEKLIEQQTNELGIAQNQCDSIKVLIQEYSEELDAKEKRHEEILETIRRSSSEMVERAKAIEAAETEAIVRSDKLTQEVKEEEKELELVKNKTETEKEKLVHLKSEADRKMRYLEVILPKIQESNKQLAVVDEKLESQQRLLAAKEKRHEEILESIRRSSSEVDERAKAIEAAEAEANYLKVRSDKLRQEVKEEEKELDLAKNKIETGKERLVQLKNEMDRKKRYLELIHSKIQESNKQLAVVDEKLESQLRLLAAKEKRHEEILEIVRRSSSEMVERAKQIEAAETEASCLRVRSDKLRQEVEGEVKELDLVKNQIETEKEKLVQLKSEMEKETDRKKKDLALILSKIQESDQQLAVVDEKLESQQRLLEEKSTELLSKEKELECVGESCKRFSFDLEVKEKRLQVVNKMIKISGQHLDFKSKELEEVQRESKLKKQLRRMINREKQPPAAGVETEDALMHQEIPASLSSSEVSGGLRGLPNPAEFVLELVQEDISERSGLNDSFLEILVLIFDELHKIKRVNKPQLQLKAKEVASQWKGKINIDAPKSSLEALAFLLFIVAYGLKTLINEEETALLASSIAQYEQAPRLFSSLCLNPKELATELIKKSQYIHAVRVICSFKLSKEFASSPSELLMEELINIRRSTMENRSTESSSQAKEKDAGRRLKAILELVTEYKLEINLPGDLVAKLMIQSDAATPPVHCYVDPDTSSASPLGGITN